MGEGTPEGVSFGAFRLDLAAGRLLCGDQEIQLRPKAWEVLCYLAARPGRVIPIDELLDNCWKGLHVGPHAVTNVIYLLRSVFSAGNGEADWLQSVARRGYRFAAPIESASTPRETTRQPDATVGAAAETDALFVGRQAECASLLRRWAQAVNRSPQAVFVAGEPGIGKTALVQHFLAMASPPPLLCVGRCIPHHREAEPYMPLLEALGSLGSVAELTEVAREHAPTWLLQMPWLVPSEERAELLRSLSDVGPARMPREGKRLFAALAERAPVLLLLEDIHWADASTVDLIRLLADGDRPSRLMLLATYRASEIVVNDHPLRAVVSELASRRHIEVMSLGALAPAQVGEYVERRFASPALAAEIGPRLEERSGGNPLFLEAMINYLCERDRIVCGEDGWRLAIAVEELEVGVPEGLREMIRARLRRLDGDDMRLLEAASAAGSDFTTLEVAAALELSASQAEAACERMARGGDFIRPLGEVVWPDGSVNDGYRFAHAVYQQVLDDDTPPSRRRALHARIGARLVSAFGKRARKIAPRLAAHFAAAGDLEREAEYLRMSVRLAASRYAHREELAYIDRTMEVLARLPATPERATLQLGWYLERGNLIMNWRGYAAAYESFERAAELARQQGNRFLEFIAGSSCCLTALVGRAHRLEARAQPEHLLAIAADGHPELQAFGHVVAGCVSASFGDPAGALTRAEAAEAALPDALQGLPRGVDLASLVSLLFVVALTRIGELDRVRRERARAVEAAETRAGLIGQAYAFAYLACEALLAAEPAVALHFAERAIDCAREGGYQNFQLAGEAAREAASIALAADCAIESAALVRLEAAIEARERMDENWYNTLFTAYAADAYRRTGELKKAQAKIEAAFPDAEPGYVAELWRIRGEVELATARGAAPRSRAAAVDAAASSFRRAVDLAHEQGAKLFELRAAVALASLRRDEKESRVLLQRIYRSFPQGIEGVDLRTAAALLRESNPRGTIER
jgi:DNA-binding winged helix-turn-helix (wHTH) protein